MSDPGEALAAAALDLVGAPFQLHGRNPATGLDCVGLVSAALAAAGGNPVAMGGYGLRNLGVDKWLPLAELSGLKPTVGPIRKGDVLLVGLGFAQHHLVVVIDAGTVVHAHAGLRRVVCQSRDPRWQVCATWRMATPSES